MSSVVVDGRLESAITLAQQHRDVASAIQAAGGPGEVRTGHGQIEFTVPIEIAHGNRTRIPTGVEIDGRLKGAVAVAQQHGDGAVSHRPRRDRAAEDIRAASRHVSVGHGEVKLAVVVEIAHRHEDRKGFQGPIYGGLERAIAATQEYGDAAVARGGEAGSGQIKLAVAIEVAHRHRNRISPRAVVDGGLKGAASCAQQHANPGAIG